MNTWQQIDLHSRAVAWLLAGVAAILLAVAIYDVTVNILSARNETADAADGTAEWSPPARIRSREDAGQIVAAHLFGRSAEEQPTDTRPIDAPETQLRLTLQGILAADEPLYSRAIIVVEDGSANSYAIGETLQDTGATVRGIEPDHVLIERAGALERLSLAKPGESTGSGDTLPLAGRTGPQTGASNAPQPDLPTGLEQVLSPLIGGAPSE
jgi:type II secretory pathway component PulC